MRARELRLDVLQVPLASPLASARGEQTSVRLGILRLSTSDGLQGLGEVVVAQGDGVGQELGERLLAAACLGLAGIDLDDEEAVRASLAAIAAGRGGGGLGARQSRALAAALGLAIVDVAAQAAGLTVAEHLCRATADGPPGRWLACPPTAVVGVNALLGIGEPDVVAEQARALVEAGFACLKLKGGAEAPGAVRRRVAAVRAAVGPVVVLRLDLNGAFDEAAAAGLLDELAPFVLEYVEQPIPAQAGPDALARLRRRGSVPIAADEAVTDLSALRELARRDAVDAVVVKPARVGGLAAAARVAESALSAGIHVTIATMVESGVGVAGALHLAAVVPAGAHGLSTAGLLASDLVGDALVPRHGRLALPRGAGLGVALDDGAIERFRVTPVARGPVAHA